MLDQDSLVFLTLLFTGSSASVDLDVEKVKQGLKELITDSCIPVLPMQAAGLHVGSRGWPFEIPILVPEKKNTKKHASMTKRHVIVNLLLYTLASSRLAGIKRK